jgi:hypothetical protein
VKTAAAAFGVIVALLLKWLVISMTTSTTKHLAALILGSVHISSKLLLWHLW